MNDKIEWVLVPKIPTFAMRPYVAGANHEDVNGNYAAMLAAAPKPEAQAAGVDELFDMIQSAYLSSDPSVHRNAKAALAAALSTPASHGAQQRAITHCDNCGCDWLDNGINPVGCPYCKQQPGADVDLPINDAVPAPTKIEPGNLFLWNWRAMQEYARTCIAAQQPAVVGDGVRSLPAEWRSTAARHRSRGTGQSVAQANGYDMAANMLEAALAPAATPGDDPVPWEWRWVDENDRAMTAWKRGDPPPMLDVSDSKGTMRVEVRIAQKEGNGNG